MQAAVSFPVRYAETDAQSVVYYGNHFAWFELGYEALLAQLDLSLSEGRPAVREACCRYRAPIRYGETVTVASRVAAQDADGLWVAHEIRVGPELRAEGTTLLACRLPVTPDGIGERGSVVHFEGWAALAPRGRTEEVELRVRFAETEPSGKAHFFRYFAWLEVGRIAYLRRLGMDYAKLQRLGSPFVIAWAACRYLSPVGFDEPVRVQVWIEEVRRRSYVAGYRLLHGDDGRPIAVGKTVQAFIDLEGRPTRIPEVARERLLAAAQGSDVLPSPIVLEAPGSAPS